MQYFQSVRKVLRVGNSGETVIITMRQNWLLMCLRGCFQSIMITQTLVSIATYKCPWFGCCLSAYKSKSRTGKKTSVAHNNRYINFTYSYCVLLCFLFKSHSFNASLSDLAKGCCVLNKVTKQTPNPHRPLVHCTFVVIAMLHHLFL